MDAGEQGSGGAGEQGSGGAGEQGIWLIFMCVCVSDDVRIAEDMLN
jgi:hypothetical protein